MRLLIKPNRLRASEYAGNPPAYLQDSRERCKGSINGQNVDFVNSPNKHRVVFKWKGTCYYVDNDDLFKLVAGQVRTFLHFYID